MPYKKSGRVTKFIYIFTISFITLLAVVSTFGQSSRMVEGKDYVTFNRLRIIDEMGFDKPVEAMSMLVPKGWKTQTNIRWNSIGGCRDEIVVWEVSFTSPDGAIQFRVFPNQTFVYSQAQVTQQTLVAAAQQGGCKVNAPFNAKQYLENLARNGLRASVSKIRTDEALQAALDQLNANNEAASRQYGTGMTYFGSVVYGTLSWTDGNKGLARIGVMGSAFEGRDLYGSPNGFARTSVFHQSVISYPPAREAEALKLFGTFMTSHRINPIWAQAKEKFLTQLGNAEHAQRMERIRLMGEQSRAYAKAQSDASNARMRDWERSQASSDTSHKSFIQTIREVETWKDSSGNAVELGSGYNYGWSKPDGSYILTNNSLFNPAVELKENWVKMQKAPQ